MMKGKTDKEILERMITCQSKRDVHIKFEGYWLTIPQIKRDELGIEILKQMSMMDGNGSQNNNND